MKIVYCIYSLSGGGGVGRVLITKVNYLVDKGYDVTIITAVKDTEAPFYPLDKRAKVVPFCLKYEGHISDKPIWKRFILSLNEMWSYRRQLKNFIKEYKPDIVITTHTLLTLLIPSLKDRSCKVQELHNSKYMYRGLKPINRFSLKNILMSFYEYRDKFFMSFFDIVASLTEKDKILRGSPRNMEVIYNPIHFKLEGTSNLENKEVLALGRFTEQKDFSSLLDIWAIVMRSCPDWHLKIVGEGYLETELKRKIVDLRLSSSVILVDEQKDVEKLYLESSIYVMTSRFEGFGLVLAEAQNFGIPSISYDCPCGPSDVITDGENGFLVKSNDKETFAQRLIELMQDNDLRKKMGLNAKEASKRFEVDTIMPQWEAIFQRLYQRTQNKS